MSRLEDESTGFLGRWAKRKQAVQLESRQKALEPSPEVQLPAAAPAEKPIHSDEQHETNLPLPSLEEVLPGGDISVFLQKHIPDSLRNAALRKAWLADPEISGFIEMADYQWDFTKPDSIPGWSASLEGYDVKGMMEKVLDTVAPSLRPETVQADLAETTPDQGLVDCEENIIMDTKNKEKAVISLKKDPDDAPKEIHVAPQKNTMDSGVYENHKKRHGSALPS
jgi:Protein of unknown function (DUF3306)